MARDPGDETAAVPASVPGEWRHGWAPPVLVFFTSGAVLVLEILAGRLVAPYVGVSLETYTGIIGTVLAGIAGGSAAGGWLADRRDPGRMIGPLLIAAGVTSLAVVPIIGLLGPRIAATDGGPAGIVTLAVAAFVLPTALLSAITPMVAKLRLSTIEDTGAVVGGLSAAGTAGALVGTFATGFVFVAAWPTRPIVLAVSVALVATGAAVSIRLGRGRRAVSLVLALVLVIAVARAAPSPCERETRYYCASVVPDPDRPSGRTLVLDNLRHSYVDLEDATHLEFRYTQLFAATVDAALPAGPLRALHVGGGGFTFPRWLAATRPGTRNLVLEVDPEIVALAQRDLGLELDADLRVRTGDARLNIGDEPAQRFDLVVGDAFGGLSVPWHLATVEMIRAIDRVLRPGGLYVLNVIDAGPQALVRAEVAALGVVFAHVAVLAPPDGPSGNHVLVASHDPFDLATVPPADGTLIAGDGIAPFVAGAQPLRDDFAPADQLLTHR